MNYPAYGTPYNRNQYPQWAQNPYQQYPPQPFIPPPPPQQPKPRKSKTKTKHTPFIPPSPEPMQQNLDSGPPYSSTKSHKRVNTFPAPTSVGGTMVKGLKSALKRSKTTKAPPPAMPDPDPPYEAPAKAKFKPPSIHSDEEDIPPEPSMSTQPHEAQQFTSRNQQQHVFVSFVGDDELKLRFCSYNAMNEIRDTIFPLWSEGIAEEHHHGYEWYIRFNSIPWKSSQLSVPAYLMILELWALFSKRGYSAQGVINISIPPPSFIFVASSAAETTFFALYFSRRSSRITIIKPPPALDQQFEPALRSRIGSSLLTDRKIDPVIRILEIAVDSNGEPVLAPLDFLMNVMVSLVEIGFDFDACVPLGKKRLGTAARRELLIFRQIRPDSQEN